MKRVYISKSVLIEDTSPYFQNALAFFRENDIEYKYWDKRTPYIPSIFDSSDVLIYLKHPEYSNMSIGKGSFTEIEKAQKLGIPVLLMYLRKSDNSFQLYEMDYHETGSVDYNRYGELTFKDNQTQEFLRGKICYQHNPIDDVTIITNITKSQKKKHKTKNIELLLLRRI